MVSTPRVSDPKTVTAVAASSSMRAYRTAKKRLWIFTFSGVCVSAFIIWIIVHSLVEYPKFAASNRARQEGAERTWREHCGPGQWYDPELTNCVEASMRKDMNVALVSWVQTFQSLTWVPIEFVVNGMRSVGSFIGCHEGTTCAYILTRTVDTVLLYALSFPAFMLMMALVVMWIYMKLVAYQSLVQRFYRHYSVSPAADPIAPPASRPPPQQTPLMLPASSSVSIKLLPDDADEYDDDYAFGITGERGDQLRNRNVSHWAQSVV